MNGEPSIPFGEPATDPATTATRDFRDPWVWGIAAAVAIAHLAVAPRYDFFRNELYFIVCGRHPDFGYADQPPLVPLLAAATQLWGDDLWLLRLPGVIAAAALAPITAAIALALGGGRVGAITAAVAVSIAPGLIALTTTLGTPTLEPAGWTLCAYLVLRAVMRGESVALLWAALVAGVSLEAKYGIAIWLVGLCVGVTFSDGRRILATRTFAWACLATILIGAPSLIWQALHGWPFLTIIAFHSAEGRIFTGGPVRFLATQALAMNAILAPLWLAGLVAPYMLRALKPARILSVAFAVTALAVFGAHGKDYYLFPAYPSIMAAGAAAAVRLNKWARRVWLILAFASLAVVSPLVLPILDPPALRRFIVNTGLSPAPNERAAVGAPITQVFSDEFGWRELETAVAAVWRDLPASQRSGTGIFATNYGEAAALDFYGRADGLPPAMSGDNQYFLWGPRDDPHDLILINNVGPGAWRLQRCGSVQRVGTFGAPFAMPYERDRPIYLCRNLVAPLSALWPDLKRVR